MTKAKTLTEILRMIKGKVDFPYNSHIDFDADTLIITRDWRKEYASNLSKPT